MKKIAFAALIFASIVTVSCTKKRGPAGDDPLSFKSDAEYSPVWINERCIQEVPNAHSGTRASVTDSSMQFSLGLRKKLSDVADGNAKSVVITAWVNAQSLGDMNGLQLVASIDNNGKNLFFQGAPVGDKVKEANKWYLVTEKIPFDYQPGGADDIFIGYVLNNTKAKVLVDDIEFHFETK